MITLVATAFAGCLSADSGGEPTISRVYTLTVDPATARAAEEKADNDPEAALRELLATTIVVRVENAGDYTLEFTDESGAPQTRTLTGLQPGSPQSVEGADPLAPVVLKQGETVITVRGGINAVWWHAGDMPLGLNMTPGAKAKYTFANRVQEGLTLTDLKVEQQGVEVSSLSLTLRLPIEGTASWELGADAGEGQPLTVAGEVHVPPAAGDLGTLEVTASMNGEPGTAGFVAGVNEATASGSARMWIRDGQPIAAQFLGGTAKFDPKVSVWADGFFADMSGEFSCAGKTRADNCQPEELDSFEETQAASEKETFEPADYPKVEDEEARKALALIERIFAQDLQVGDKLVFKGGADAEDLAGGDPTAPKGDFEFSFTLEAVGIEDVTVPAGTFQAIKLIEETRTRVNVEDFTDPDGNHILSALSIDETIARATYWLDAKTYQPLKMTATTPFNADALVKSILNAIDDDAWADIGGKPIDSSKFTLTALAESSYEATEVAPTTQFSAVVGLALAHTVGGALASGPATMITGMGMPFGRSYGTSEAVPAYPEYGYDDMGRPITPYPPTREPVHMSISSSGPLANGLKTYTVASASEGLSWGDLMVTVDDEAVYLDDTAGCGTATIESWTACRAASTLSYGDMVTEGDTATFAVNAGQQLRFIDMYANSVIMQITVS